jgi:hypothetical protein
MRRSSILFAVLALALSVVPTAGADDLRAGPGPGYIATDNVEWLGTIPINTDSAGGRLVDGYFYVTDDRGLTIYDTKDPANPQRVGFAAVPQGAYYVEEDVDTNGSIALIGSYGDLSPASSGPLNRLVVLDVKDKANPKVIGQLEGVDSHTVSCVMDCTYAYNSDGKIIDLRDPTAPKLVGNWATGSPVKGAHDVSEVAPGIVLTSSNPMVLLDANADPAKPAIVGTGSPGDKRFMHGNLWPQGGTDAFVLAGGETFGNCKGKASGGFMTFKPTTDEVTGQTTMTMVDQYHVATGVPTDGNSPYNQFCAHWFDTHPTYADGGLVAMGWYEHGTRFLDVSDAGTITEKGWFYPVGGSTSAAYWITDEIVYAVDYQRGIDILRFTDAPAAGTTRVAASPGYRPLDGDQPRAPRAPVAAKALDKAFSRDPYACPLPGL